MEMLEKYLVQQLKELSNKLNSSVSASLDVWFHKHNDGTNETQITYDLYRADTSTWIIKAKTFGELAKKLQQELQTGEEIPDELA